MSEADFDESDKAQLVCKFLGGTKHHEFLLDSEKIKEVLTSTLSLSDEPHGDPGLVNSFFWRLHQVLL